jgi:hypothetical protein
MASDAVRYEQRDTIALISLDDGKANAVSPALVTALNAALDRAERDAQAVVLTGRAGRFSAGFDLSVMTGGVESMRALVQSGAELCLRMFAFPRPLVIAAAATRSPPAPCSSAPLICASGRRGRSRSASTRSPSSCRCRSSRWSWRGRGWRRAGSPSR